MGKTEELLIVEEKLRKLGTSELMFIYGAADAFLLIQNAKKQKNEEQNSLRSAL